MGNTNFDSEDPSDFDQSLLKLKIPLKLQMTKQFRIFSKPFFENKTSSAWKAEIIKTKKIVVIKKLKKTNRNVFLKEIFILMKIDHPNIIQIFEFFQTPSNFFMVYPFFKGQPVIDFFLENKKKMDFEKMKKFMNELLITISYLHKNGVSHRDIVPKYVLWNGEHLNLCGFTKSGIFTKNKNNFQKKNFEKKTINNLYFTSPEMFKCDYTYKNDIWNCGILFYLLVFGKTPFNGKTENEIRENIINQKLIFKKKKKIQKSLKNLITAMLEKNDKKRKDISELLKFEFFKKKKNSELSIPTYSENSFIELKNFKKKSKFFNYLKKYITQKLLSKKEKEEISKLFKKLDKNSDGILDKSELLELTGSTLCFIENSQITKFIKKHDLNKNGVIEYSEFMGAMVNLRVLKKKEILEQFFHLMDVEEKGYFGFKEFKQVLGYKVNEKIVKKTFKKFADKDFMDKESFVRFLEFVIEEFM